MNRRSRKPVRMADTPLFPETHVLTGVDPEATRPLNITLFAGMGGACVGLERGMGERITHAINHWPVAIQVHRANHPDTQHLIADVMEVDPLSVTQGRPVGVLWASPDCTSFSPAKGAAPVKQGLRMLPWSILMWLGKTRPEYLLGENVPAMARWWGPLVFKRDAQGRPVLDKAGHPVMVNTKHPKKRDQRWRRFRREVERLGYRFEWRVLNAADYGAPTRRERLFFVASRSGEPFPWPEPTHAPANDPRVLTGERRPWVPVGPLLDHDRDVPSIFEPRKNGKMLAEATLVRTAWGVLKEVLQTDTPYLVGPAREDHVGARMLIPDNHQNPPWSAWRPAPTLTGQTNRILLGEAGLQALVWAEPGPLCAPFISKAFTSKRAHHNRSASLHGGLPTITAQDHNQLATARLLSAGFLSTYYGGPQGEARSGALNRPVTTLTGARRQALGQVLLAAGAAHLVWYNNGEQWHSVPLSSPARTFTAKPRAAYALTAMQAFRNTAYDRSALPLTVLEASPGRTRTPKGTLRLGEMDLGAFPHVHDVYELMLRVCGREALALYADHERRIIFKQVEGQIYLLPDIGLRMLHYTELARAQGFTDYILDRGADGQSIAAEDVVKLIGNSVCPQMGEAFGRVLGNLLNMPTKDCPPRWWSQRRERAGVPRTAA